MPKATDKLTIYLDPRLRPALERMSQQEWRSLSSMINALVAKEAALRGMLGAARSPEDMPQGLEDVVTLANRRHKT